MTIKRGNSIPNLRHCSSSSTNDTIKSKPVKKSVRFAKSKRGDVSVHVKIISAITGEDKKKVYFSNSDKQDMRDNAFDTVRDLSCHSSRMTMMPDRNSYTSLLTRAFVSCDNSHSRLTPEEHEELMKQVAESHAHFRGLEKLTIQRTIKDNRLRLRRNSIRDLVESYSMEMANNGYLSSKVEDSLLETYRRSSSASRKFARFLAQLDEEAVELQRQTEEEDNYVVSRMDEAASKYSVYQDHEEQPWRESHEVCVECCS
eukprot:CAMPEP_0194202628 /NCGR_PEP_ID=MMETSP0156-20130528/2609_1 /TAXON_ID=33649 /ORGANISM="Thalassionema nitzschioides, Strain L26-B" /LENGTH=257 /DNA_ID=CAMNT_0038928179 /DNA_START=61 /DNA_END=834 /DNA_ORIENTATION=+